MLASHWILLSRHRCRLTGHQPRTELFKEILYPHTLFYMEVYTHYAQSSCNWTTERFPTSPISLPPNTTTLTQNHVLYIIFDIIILYRNNNGSSLTKKLPLLFIHSWLESVFLNRRKDWFYSLYLFSHFLYSGIQQDYYRVYHYVYSNFLLQSKHICYATKTQRRAI